MVKLTNILAIIQRDSEKKRVRARETRSESGRGKGMQGGREGERDGDKSVLNPYTLRRNQDPMLFCKGYIFLL